MTFEDQKTNQPSEKDVFLRTLFPEGSDQKCSLRLRGGWRRPGPPDRDAHVRCAAFVCVYFSFRVPNLDVEGKAEGKGDEMRGSLSRQCCQGRALEVTGGFCGSSH